MAPRLKMVILLMGGAGGHAEYQDFFFLHNYRFTGSCEDVSLMITSYISVVMISNSGNQHWYNVCAYSVPFSYTCRFLQPSLDLRYRTVSSPKRSPLYSHLYTITYPRLPPIPTNTTLFQHFLILSFQDMYINGMIQCVAF